MKKTFAGLVITLAISITCIFSGSANAYDEKYEQTRAFEALDMCQRTTINFLQGEIRIQPAPKNHCYYASTFNGQKFECNFPMKYAHKYSFYKRIEVGMSDSQYKEMKLIEKTYCRHR